MKTPEEIKKGLEYASTTNIARKVMLAKAGKVPYAYMEEAASDALAYIRQLEAKVPKWISVKERLPERNTAVIVAVDDGHVFQTLYAYDGWDLWEGCTCNVTHWMPMPLPPEEEV